MDVTKQLTKKLLLLSHCRGVGWKTTARFLKKDPSLSNLYNLSQEKVQEITKLSPSKCRKIISDFHNPSLHDQIEQLQKTDVKILPIYDLKYPKLLKEIFDPPWLLYLKGDLRILKDYEPIAIVGSRQATAYGRLALEKIVPNLVKNKFTVVSGLAKGIDTLAHKMTIAAGGKTMAVIAGGFDHIYPQENKSLAEEIANNHLLISESPPSFRPAKFNFPLRNRIISGLSVGSFVVEARERSGSFITADFSLNEGREVFALPGDFHKASSRGTNILIQKGAKLVLKSEDIIEELRPFN